MHTEPTQPVHSIHDLLNGGDWACAENEPEGLAHVCRELARVINSDIGPRAEHIARMTDYDMPLATREWQELSEILRHRHVSLETQPRKPLPPRPFYSRNRPDT